MAATMYRMQQMNGDMKNKIISHIHLFSSTFPQWGHLIAFSFISSLQAGHCFVFVSMLESSEKLRLSYHKVTGGGYAYW